MSEVGSDRATVFLSRAWKLPETEVSFVTRTVAGAASRTTRVTVVVPAPVGTTEPDGAFDLFGAGSGHDGSWPDPTETAWPGTFPAETTTIIVDDPDPATLALLAFMAPDQPVHAIAPTDDPFVSPLKFTGPAGSNDFISLHVPINPIAATHRHNGLGFTGYILVLSDRVGADVSPPTDMVAWLTARFPNLEVVVIEDASAAVWRGRVLRGVISVYTRTDLWRLLAHARMTIDLAPGPIIARECVESLRFGTPILVPQRSVAQAHTDAGGGISFSGYAELLAGVTRLCDENVRSTASSNGRRYADARYGNQQAFVDSVSRAVGAALGKRSPGGPRQRE
jgi:hypothetical protein